MVEKSKFVCKVCGYQSPKWVGRCPECGEWDCLVEEKKGGRISSLTLSPPQALSEIPASKETRYSSNIGEFDRILGGGIVPGSVILVGGEPGIGKSTLLIEVAERISRMGFPILYISGEESVQQTRIRAARLGIKSASLYILSENNLEVVQNQIAKLEPKIVIVDSIQTIYLDSLNSSAGTISQVRECTASLVRMAKKEEITAFLVGHVTKDGSIAGPRIMEHMVDTVLYFESSQDFQYRILRATKNRFGPTSEIGIFKMGDRGLVEVVDSSTLFITDSFLRNTTPGTAIVPAVEGSRVFLIEIQTLVDRSNLAIPRRVTQGVDYNRVYLLLAVLGRRGFNFYQKDVYVNVAGGVKVDEPACDLAITLSLASSIKNRPLKSETVVVGEVGLTGEVRPVGFMEHRLQEAKKLGFKRCIGPFLEKKEADKEKKIEFIAVRSIEEAIHKGLEER
ncbi:DNA repair protein RadA [Candidatus Aerophobetes bacterium]|nr:DNA repair protein RadA [Candidatus Aerophobetes bacterium]